MLTDPDDRRALIAAFQAVLAKAACDRGRRERLKREYPQPVPAQK